MQARYQAALRPDCFHNDFYATNSPESELLF
jgi:hypothetical protein